MVRPWLNTVPGHWQPQPADPRTTSLDGLGSAVERALRQVLRISPAPRGPAPGEAEPAPPYVEFVLPYELLNHDVAGLTVRSGDGKPLPLGLKYGVHLRSLERMRTDDGLVRAQWRERWSTLQNRGIAVHGWRSSDSGGLDEWQTTLAAEPSRTAAVLDAPDGAAATEALKAAIAEGIGLAVWDRRGDFPEERREVVAAVFAAVQKPGRLPVVIHQLRRRAELNAAGPRCSAGTSRSSGTTRIDWSTSRSHPTSNPTQGTASTIATPGAPWTARRRRYERTGHGGQS